MPVVVPCGQVVVVVLVVVLVVIEGVVVDVAVVVGVQSGSPGSPVQVQVPVLHCAMADLRHMLRALPDKPAHPAAISSEQDLLLHAGGAAVVTEETKTPAPSATAANVTPTLLVIVIVEPPARHQFGALSRDRPDPADPVQREAPPRAGVPQTTAPDHRVHLRHPQLTFPRWRRSIPVPELGYC